jgi:plastocyanin
MVADSLVRPTRFVSSLLFALLAAGCSCSCSGGEPASSDETPAQAAQEKPATGGEGKARSGRGAAAELTATVAEPLTETETGGVHAVFLFEGTPPERYQLGAASSPECKHHPDVDQRWNLVLVEDGKLANVFLTLKSGVDPARVPPVPDTVVELDQKGCMYIPRVVGLRVGQKFLVKNSDPTTHNVNLRAKRNQDSNRSMGAKQKPLEFAFDRRELGFLVKCDIHPWMGAQVYVEEHPWFGISDSGGSVRITGIPPGEYTLEAQHEELGTMTGKVTVTAGSSSGFTGTFRAK